LAVSRDPDSPLQKAFAVLKLLAEAEHPMNAPDIGGQLGMNRQTVHRLLNQLEAIGMVRRDVARERFEVGPAMVELGLRAQSGNHAARLRRAVMEELVAEVRENCNLAVLDGHEIVYVDHVECDWPLRRQIAIGDRMPAYCTAIGKLLLAHLPAKALEQYLSVVTLEPWTEHTWTDPDGFREHLEDIRRQGYATNEQENMVGLLAAAVPVRDTFGRIAAGLSIHGPKPRLSEARTLEIIPQVSEAASTLGELVGENSARRLMK